MPWTAAQFKEKHFKDATDAQAEKASQIANAMLKDGADEGVAIATAIKKAKELASSGLQGDKLAGIMGTWEGEFNIVAAADSTVAPPASMGSNIGSAADRGPGAQALPNPNPSAKLDVPDATDANKATGGNAGAQPLIPRLPKFALSAYNGGAMKLKGYDHPIVIDANGVQFATNPLPIFAGGHIEDNATPAEIMDALVGQGQCSVENGRIMASGYITGDSQTVRNMMSHVRHPNPEQRFKFQNSVYGNPTQAPEFVAHGSASMVNGRMVSGPAYIARSSVLTHIAILPLGADTSTSAQIAATGTPAGKGNTMDPKVLEWIKANFGLDGATLSADQQGKFKAQYDAAEAAKLAASGAAAEAAKLAATGAGTPDPAKIAANGAAQTDSAIAAQNAALSANMDRVNKINALAGTTYPAIAAQAVKEGWSFDKTEHEVLKAQMATLTKSTFGASGEFAIHDGGKDWTPDLAKEGGYQNLAASYGGRDCVEAGPMSVQDVRCRIIEAAVLMASGARASGDSKGHSQSWSEHIAASGQYGARIASEAERVMQASGFGHSIGPVAMFDIACRFAGISLPRNHKTSDYFRKLAAAFTTAQLDFITANVQNKFLQDGYTAVDPDHAAPPDQQVGSVAWKKIVKMVPLNDFKPHFFDRLVGDMEMLPMRDTGEIEHGRIGDQAYRLTADTYAILLEISRKTIINDDQSALSTVPTQFGRGAGIRHARLIYGALLGGLQSDGATAFFTASDVTTDKGRMVANLMYLGENSILDMSSMLTLRNQFMLQTDPYGLPAGFIPQILLTPPGNLDLALAWYQGTQLIANLATTSGATGRGTPDLQTLKGRYMPVCSQWLANGTNGTRRTAATNGDNSSVYMMAAPSAIGAGIMAGFLNGQEMPVVERGEPKFDVLGIGFRGFTDFGCSLAEPRAIVMGVFDDSPETAKKSARKTDIKA
jgi:hypothetical protein